MRFIILAAALALPATAFAQDPAPVPKAADYVTKAAKSDQFEIQAGRLAQTKGTSPDVKAFGAMMVKDHTASTAMIAAAAPRAPAAPPVQLDPDQQAMLTELQAQTGEAFDTTYMTQQLAAHKQALALHTAYAQSGDNANLRSVAAKIVPVVQTHIGMLPKTPTGSEVLPKDAATAR